MPSLESKRLLLRPFVPADATTIQLLASDKRIAATTLSIPHPYPEGAAANWLAQQAKLIDQAKLLPFAITRKTDAELLGVVSLHPNSAHDKAELGYWLGVPYWGQGYTSEAAARVLAYGFEVLKLNRIHAHCFAENSASKRVLEKIGMAYEGRLRQEIKKWDNYVDVLCFGILRAEYFAKEG